MYPTRIGQSNPNWKGGLPSCLGCEKVITRHTKYGRCKQCSSKLKEFRLLSSDSHRGQKAWNEGLKGFLAGSSHYKWNKGTSTKYSALHNWVKRRLGKAGSCIKCLSNENIQWSNISNEYKRDLDDWQQLCVKCHKEYDKQQRIIKAA